MIDPDYFSVKLVQIRRLLDDVSLSLDLDYKDKPKVGEAHEQIWKLRDEILRLERKIDAAIRL